MRDNTPSKREIRQSKRLLRAVLDKDFQKIDGMLDKGVNPNCVFDGIPLLTVAAFHGVSLQIMHSLMAYGADPTLPIRAGIKDGGKAPFSMTKDPVVKTFLEKAYQESVRHQDELGIQPAYGPALNITLGQFCYDYHSLEMNEMEFYTNSDYPGPKYGKGDNRLSLYIEPDRMPCLLDNLDTLLYPSADAQEAIAVSLLPRIHPN